MKKVLSLLLSFLIILLFSCCSSANENRVVIYSSVEEYRNEYFLYRLREEFPDYEIVIQYFSTGNNAAKLKSEGKQTDCDIVLGLESTYLEDLKDNFADLSEYDFSKFKNEFVPKDLKYMIWERYSGSVLINDQMLEKLRLPVPASYGDLLDKRYQGLITMPNPKTSGTGFIFLRNLINTMGEEAAYAYFDSLAENVLQFTSSGSGPVNSLVQGETAIGLGMTFQAVSEINKGAPLSIHYFEEGAPYTTDGMAIIESKKSSRPVEEVFRFIYETLIYENRDLYMPESVLKENADSAIPNYPHNISYADMTGLQDIREKKRLLEKWKY